MSKENAGGWVRNKAEGGANFFEKLHYGLGAAALASALIFPPAEAALATVGVYEVAHGFVWNFIKNKIKK
jgi:hypothetical protein